MASDLIVLASKSGASGRNSTNVFELELNDHARGVYVGIVQHILPITPVVHDACEVLVQCLEVRSCSPWNSKVGVDVNRK